MQTLLKLLAPVVFTICPRQHPVRRAFLRAGLAPWSI